MYVQQKQPQVTPPIPVEEVDPEVENIFHDNVFPVNRPNPHPNNRNESLKQAYQAAKRADAVFQRRNQDVNEATGVVGLSGGFLAFGGALGVAVGLVISFGIKYWWLGDMRPFGPTAVEIVKYVDKHPEATEEEALKALLRNTMKKKKLEHKFPSDTDIKAYAARHAVNNSMAMRELVRFRIDRG